MQPSFSKNLGPISVETISKLIQCELVNISTNESFNEFVGTKNIKDGIITFLNDNEVIKKNSIDNFSVICTKKKYKLLKKYKLKAIIVKNVQEAVARLSNIFYRDYNKNEISKFNKAKIGNNCNIDDYSKIENGALLGDNVSIGSGVFIGHNCIIGDNSIIEANAVITNSIIGENVKIGRNSSIGQNGFGFYMNKKSNIDIYHCGKVILEPSVSIGSGCTIDRGSFDDTIIGENTYLDNLCHIAHNVQIGRNSAFAAMTGIAGSAKIGNNVLAGGQVGIAGHVCIGNNVEIAAKSGVFNSLDDGQAVMGNPAINRFRFIRSYKKNYGK